MERNNSGREREKHTHTHTQTKGETALVIHFILLLKFKQHNMNRALFFDSRQSRGNSRASITWWIKKIRCFASDLLPGRCTACFWMVSQDSMAVPLYTRHNSIKLGFPISLQIMLLILLVRPKVPELKSKGSIQPEGFVSPTEKNWCCFCQCTKSYYTAKHETDVVFVER